MDVSDHKHSSIPMSLPNNVSHQHHSGFLLIPENTMYVEEKNFRKPWKGKAVMSYTVSDLKELLKTVWTNSSFYLEETARGSRD